MKLNYVKTESDGPDKNKAEYEVDNRIECFDALLRAKSNWQNVQEKRVINGVEELPPFTIADRDSIEKYEISGQYDNNDFIIELVSSTLYIQCKSPITICKLIQHISLS